MYIFNIKIITNKYVLRSKNSLMKRNKNNITTRVTNGIADSLSMGHERFADCFEKKDNENFTYISNKALNHISTSNRF